MVLLRANKSDEVPKDAVILTEQQAYEYQWDVIREHGNEGKVWSLKYGAGILGILSGFTGIYINQHYRGRLRLGSFGAFSTYLPTVALPAIATVVYHRVFIQSSIVLSKERCPVCMQVKASLSQAALGVAYPALLAPVSAYMFATRHFTFRLPPISRPKELFAVYKKMTTPLTTFLSIALALHVVIAMALTQKEIIEYHKLEQDSINEELLT